MKWEVVVTTEKGTLVLPIEGYYKTKKEAERIALQAQTMRETLSTEVRKVG